MQVSHGVSVVFDDPNLVSCAGLVPVLDLAERCGLHRLVADTVTVSGPAAANAAVKVPALVAGMVAGADSIDDMDLLRHGGMGRLFSGIRAPSTLGSFLRSVPVRPCPPARQGRRGRVGQPGRSHTAAVATPTRSHWSMSMTR